MKILVISQFYTPDITAAAFRIAETTGYLRSIGHEVEVITTYPHKSDVQPEEVADEEGLHRVHLPETEGNGFLGYIYLYLSFMVKSIISGYRVGRRQQPDVIWASSPPLFVGLSGWVLARFLSAKFVLDIRDIWPASAAAAGQISEEGRAYALGRSLEKFLYRQADAITCVASPMKKYIEKYTDTGVEIIYNGVDIKDDSNPKSEGYNNRLQEYGTIPDAIKLLYAGNFGHVQQLEVAIDALAELRTDVVDREWELFLLGGGVKKNHLKERVLEKEVSETVHFLDPVPKEEVDSYLGSSDVLFIHLQDSEVLKLTIPSKVFDYMLAEKPILAGIEGEGRNILGSVEHNILFQPGNVKSLKEAMVAMQEVLEAGNRVKENAEIVRNRYSRAGQARKLDALFKELL